jgi:hypothetical protein
MCCKFLTLLALAASALLFTGCGDRRAEMGGTETNVLGIVKYQSDDYSSNGPNTFAISTAELYNRENFSGNKLTFLWGLVTIKDY